VVLAGPLNLAAGQRDARCTGPTKGAHGGPDARFERVTHQVPVVTIDELLEAGTGARAVHDDLVVHQPADHVEVHHRHGVGERHHGVGGIVAAAQEAAFLPGECGAFRGIPLPASF
jgi:hypothetical protein